jgi:hypothetical protein
MRLGGTFGDTALGERLREPCQINWQKLLEQYGDRKFLDHPPGLPIMLQIIWDDLFVEYAAQQLSESTSGISQRAVDLTVSVDKVTGDLQGFYGFKSSGPRSPGIPKAAWVKDALDALVEFKLARQTEDGEFIVSYKRLRGDTMERFGRLCFRRKPQPQPNDKQTTLKFE